MVGVWASDPPLLLQWLRLVLLQHRCDDAAVVEEGDGEMPNGVQCPVLAAPAAVEDEQYEVEEARELLRPE